MYNLFYELIQVAIGIRAELSRIPSSSEWQMLYNIFDNQALVGIGFSGVQKLKYKQKSQLENLSSELRKQWLGRTARIQMRNETMNKQCVFVQRQFAAARLDTCILKGQGVGTYYNSELCLLRQPGDIDLWVNASWEEVMDYVNAQTPNREFDMKHTHLEAFPDTIVEVHWWPSMPINFLYRKALQSYYRNQSPIQCNHQIQLQDGTIIIAPDAKFEAVHVLYHIVNHFLYEGIGLRQMMDLFFVLVNGGLTDDDRGELQQTYKEVGLSKIAPAVMWVLCDVFKMDERYCIGSKDIRLGRVLLKEIEEGGNFGTHSEENRVHWESFAHKVSRRMKRRIRLIRYNPLGVISAPLTKIRTVLWRRKVIKMFNL